MHLFTMILAGAFFGVAAYFLMVLIEDFRKEKGSVGKRFLAAGENSVTKLWMRLVGLVTAGLGSLASFTDYLDKPGVTDFIKTALRPEWVAGALLGIVVITLFARNRTLNK